MMIVAPDLPIPPATWTGVLTPIALFLTIVFLLFDRIFGRGRTSQRMESKVEEMCNDLVSARAYGLKDHQIIRKVERDLTAHILEWRGVEGNNGYRSILREIQIEVKRISQRNERIDAVTAVEEEQMRRQGLHEKRLRDRVRRSEQDNARDDLEGE